jgi:hypothetical protein
MIEYQDSPWQEPCPVPLPTKALADPSMPPCEGDQAATPATPPEGQPSSLPFVVLDDDYQWMILL